ncbi:hypothetical protein FHS39_001960 [Streptomyces olivoverticillatus]|uniref:Uncharacterized protein n=1 Tax=Streptomyces olivoverticillatus TaxID=66427 RepID=A0A7W7LMQ9_9ACTN|nr:hypothetical protein [Streptomyces olivoverticillatus]MBB4892949.1 hypothetical protein [Streptomyces olivoverticillatus]
MPHTPEQTSEAPYQPAVGDLVWDAASKRVGQVMDHRWSRYQLRPPGGGTEWHAAPENVSPTQARQAPCPQCRRIKAERYEAERTGDRKAAAHAATEMGLHQRAAHS